MRNIPMARAKRATHRKIRALMSGSNRSRRNCEVDRGIAGENALVLGGSKGLGFACALELSRAGVRVAINGRDAEGGAAALKQLGDGAIFVKGDVAEPGQVAAIVETVQRELGPIHIL